MFNWDEFRNEKIAVWCDTEEKAREFLDECYKNNITWGKGNIKEPKFDSYKENTCYNFEIDLFNSRLMFTEKSYYDENNYKIIKWESEKMKFKVGDKVIPSKDTQWSEKTKYRTIIEIVKNKGYKLSPYEGVITGCIWHDDELKLYEEPTEFTFQEVIARNIPGVYVNCNDEDARVESVEINECGDFTINAEFKGLREIGVGLGIYNQLKFKLQEPKKKVTIYKVEVTKGGIKWSLISSQKLEIGMFVVADKDKEYGKVVDIEYLELTDKELLEYEECWRA